MYYNNKGNYQNNSHDNNNRVNNNVTADSGESEVLGLTKALGKAIRKAVVLGTQNMFTAAITEGVVAGAKELSAQIDKNMQQLGETIGNNLKELNIAAPAAPTGPVDVTNMVSGEEYEKMESMLRQTKDRLGEVNRQNLMNEAEVKRLKSVLETKELAIQEKLTMLSKANAENKDLKLQMVDLEGKVRIMRKESEDGAAKVKLATTQKEDALAEVEALKEQLAAAKAQAQDLEIRLNKVSDELAQSKSLEIPAAPVKAAKPAKAEKPAKPAKEVSAKNPKPAAKSEKSDKQVKTDKAAKEKAPKAAAQKGKKSVAKTDNQ